MLPTTAPREDVPDARGRRGDAHPRPAQLGGAGGDRVADRERCGRLPGMDRGGDAGREAGGIEAAFRSTCAHAAAALAADFCLECGVVRVGVR